MQKLHTAVVLSALLLGACGRNEAPTAATTPAPLPPASTAPATPPPAPVATTAPGALTVKPAELKACDKAPKVVTLNWDASAVPGAKGVELWMSNPSKDPRLFVRGPNIGQKDTGPWVRPGAVFILKNKADGSEIGRAEVKSVPCP